MASKTKFNVLFFAQANADVVHVLKEIEELNTEFNHITVKVVCLTISIYKCFVCLELPEYVSVDYCKRIRPPLKKPWKRWYWRNLVDSILNKYSNNEHYDRVYFTSVNDDQVTPYYVQHFVKRKSKAFYLNHYDDKQAIEDAENVPFKQKIGLLLFHFFTNLDFTMKRMGGRWNITHFQYNKYPIRELHPVIDREICKKYAYNIHLNSKKAVLVFSQPNRDFDLISNDEYDMLLYTLVDILKSKGHYVVIKGHPTLGICLKNKNQADEEIPSMLSSELIDLSSFEACYGFLTIALGSSAKLGVPSYSILPLMSDTSSLDFEKCVRFIKESGNGRIIFLSSWDEII